MKTTIISVGGGGYNVADQVRKSGLFAPASFLSCDTDKIALNEHTHADMRFLIEKDCEKPDDLRELLEQTGDTIILCATLGGRTGSTYAPIIAHEARHAGKFVCSLFTMPWNFEGEKRNRMAAAARVALLSASKLAIQQNNNRFRDTWRDFKENHGMIDVLKSVLSSRTLEDCAMERDQGKLQALISEQYRLSGEPYIELHSNGHSVLTK